MPSIPPWRRLRDLSRWLGLLLGCGAALLPARASAARAAAAHDAPGEVFLRLDGETILFSERGAPYRALPLADAAEAAALRGMLPASGRPLAVTVGRGMVADGASGVHRPP